MVTTITSQCRCLSALRAPFFTSFNSRYLHPQVRIARLNWFEQVYAFFGSGSIDSKGIYELNNMTYFILTVDVYHLCPALMAITL